MYNVVCGVERGTSADIFENRVLRKVFVRKRDGETGQCRRLHNEELPNSRVIKSRRMRWTGHVACNGRRDVITGFWWGNERQRDELEDLDIGGRIILKCISKKWDGVMGWVDLAQDVEGWRRAVVRSVGRSVGTLHQVPTASDCPYQKFTT